MSFKGKVALVTGSSRGIGRATAHIHGGGEYERLEQVLIEVTPKKRIGTSEDIAKVIVFVCSHDADWVTGQTIVVDGGMTLTAPYHDRHAE